MAFQDVADGIEQVGADHADFVDDEQVQAADNLRFFLGELIKFPRVPFRLPSGKVWPERELEKGVDGNASGIHGGDAGGGDDDHALRAAFFELSEECSFARAGLAGQEEIRSRVAEDAEGEGCLG